MLLKEKFKGRWSLGISDKDTSYIGLLEYDPEEGGYLNLTIVEPVPQLGNKFEKFDYIFGQTDEGEKLTLINCNVMNVSWGGGGVTNVKIFTNTIFIGFWLPKKPLKNLLSLTVRFNNLPEWLGAERSGFTINHKNKFTELDIKYKQHKELKVNISNDLSVNLNQHLLTIPLKPDPISGISVNESFDIQIKVTKPKTFEYLYRLMEHLQYYFSVAQLSYEKPINIYIEKYHKDNGKNDKRWKYARVLYSKSLYNRADKKIKQHEMLFTYLHIEYMFERSLKQWIKKEQVLRISLILYIIANYRNNRSLESRFLGLIQALEVFHRKRKKGKYIDDEKFNKNIYVPLVNAIPKDVPDDFRNSIKGKLKYLHEYSLLKRIKSICNEHKDVLSNIVPGYESKLTKIVDYRNLLTHFPRNLKYDDKTIKDILLCSDLISLILELSYLKEIGFTKDKIKYLLNNQTYRRKYWKNLY